MENKKLTVEIIEWIDQDYIYGPIDKEDVFNYDVVGRTVGIVVDENEELVAVAAEYFEHADNYRHIIRIPKVCIKSRRKWDLMLAPL